MRHDAIHPISCACEQCAGPARPTRYGPDAVDPRDLAALRNGLIAGALTVGMLATIQYGPRIADWLTR